MFGIFKAATECVWVSGWLQCLLFEHSASCLHVWVGELELQGLRPPIQAADPYGQLHLSFVFINSSFSNYFYKYIFLNLFFMCGALALWLISRASVRIFPAKDYLWFAENSHLIQKSHRKWVVEIKYILGRSYLKCLDFNIKPWKL